MGFVADTKPLRSTSTLHSTHLAPLWRDARSPLLLESMPERGGPTAQSGVLYQNSIAALYLGRLCDVTKRPDADHVLRVRVEAPGDVDDIVISDADGHRAYVQVKERFAVGDTAWRGLWKDLAAQYQGSTFARIRDRLLLHIGDTHNDYYALRELCDRVPYWMPPTSVATHTLFVCSVTGSGARLAFAARSKRPTCEQHCEPMTTCSSAPCPISTRCALLWRRAARCCGSTRRHSVARASTFREQSPRKLPRGPEHHRPISRWLSSWTTQDVEDGRHAGCVVGARSRRGQGTCREGDQQLSGIKSAADLQWRLGFGEPVERVVARLATMGQVVVLLDQVDALSLSLARDQQAMNLVLELVARLR